MNHDDPNLTAYALGELSADEAEAMSARLREDPAAVLELEEIRTISERLRRELAGEGPLELSEEQRAALVSGKVTLMVPTPPVRRFPWVSLALAASVVLAIGGGLVSFVVVRRSSPSPVLAETAEPAPAPAASVPPPLTTPFPLLAQAPAPALSVAKIAVQPSHDGGTLTLNSAGTLDMLAAAPAAPPTPGPIVLASRSAEELPPPGRGAGVAARATPQSDSDGGVTPAASSVERSAKVASFAPGAVGRAGLATTETAGMLKASAPQPLDTTASNVPGRAEPPAPATRQAQFASIGSAKVFAVVRDQPRSTFPIDIDTASYTNVRRFLQNGERPPREAVRIEELLNFFTYDYPAAPADLPCSVKIEGAACPWAPEHRLVRIGLRAKAVAPAKHPPANLPVPVAKDVNVQIEFNPAQVSAYRLVGNEKQNGDAKDLQDNRVEAGDLGSGQMVTALYEIVPPGAPVELTAEPLKYQTAATAASPLARVVKSAESREMLTLQLRWKSPEAEKSSMLDVPFVDLGGAWQGSSHDFRWSAAVASFGMLLRDSAQAGSATWASTRELARGAKGDDANGHRREFLRLIDEAEAASR